MENSSAASGTYYCNAYPPGIVSAGTGTGADRSSTSSMAVSSGYSKYQMITTALQFITKPDISLLLFRILQT